MTMKWISTVAVILSLLMTACSQSKSLEFRGHKSLKNVMLSLDSITFDANATSQQGNFILMDSSLMFVDRLYCKIFSYSSSTGELLDTFSGYGQGPDEMTGIMYGSAIMPKDRSAWIINSSNGVYDFSPESGLVRYKGALDFGWKSTVLNDFESSSCYNIMEMSDFGVTMTQMDDSTVMIPLSLIGRNIEKVNKNRYDKAHILGLVDAKSLKVRQLIGRFPENLKSNPTPFFDFFDYSVDFDNSRIYTSFASDSLIYCNDFKGTILYSFGFEPDGISRDYTYGYDTTFEDFKNDISKVGANTGIFYDSQNGLLFRCSMTDFASGSTRMQIYEDSNLIAELRMPPYFKMLGKIGSKYYGVRLMPVEQGENAYFTLYKFSLKSIVR